MPGLLTNVPSLGKTLCKLRETADDNANYAITVYYYTHNNNNNDDDVNSNNNRRPRTIGLETSPSFLRKLQKRRDE